MSGHLILPGTPKVAPKFKRGIYETTYGNAAKVSGPHSKTAWDLDLGERIPISEVNPRRFLRECED